MFALLKKFWFTCFGVVLLLLGFQNCSPSQLSEGFNSLGGESGFELASVSGGGQQAYTSQQSKMGINFGTFSTQSAVDAVGNLGSWYYNYSPHPNRDDKNSTYNTVNWANAYDKEFVPMIIQKWFKYGPGDGGCPLIPEFAEKGGEPVCDVDLISQALLSMKRQFKSNNQPRYLFTFNEPHKWITNSQGQRVYAMSPGDSAKAFAKIEAAAFKAGLKIISPTASTDPDAIDWMAEFLKACYDLRNDSDFSCDINQITAFNVHEYQCASNFWNQNYGSNGAYKSQLLSRLSGYGGVDWRSFVASRSVWVTETNCNWEADFLEAQVQGKYIRTSEESCLRATGQKSGHGDGSLYTLLTLPKTSIERFVWWNTYADPLRNSDKGGAPSLSSQNRITAARLFDDNYLLTPTGRAYKQAFEDFTQLSRVDCREQNSLPLPSSPKVLTGLFILPDGGVYHGFKDFYCKYPSVSALERIYGSQWRTFLKEASAKPTGMKDEGTCGSLQGVYRDGSNYFYAYQHGYTCWINSPAKLSNMAGLSASQATQLPNSNLSALGLDNRTLNWKICL